MRKYKYSRKTGNPDCKHDWELPDDTDGTQFCKDCGLWRVPIISD